MHRTMHPIVRVQTHYLMYSQGEPREHIAMQKTLRTMKSGASHDPQLFDAYVRVCACVVRPRVTDWLSSHMSDHMTDDVSELRKNDHDDDEQA